MNELPELIGLLDNGQTRRLWLLHSALQSLPFDCAIEAALSAEAFVVGSASPNAVGEAPSGKVISPLERLENSPATAALVSSDVHPVAEHTASKRNGIALTGEQRDRLLGRLAEGAKNAELAAEFDLSAKQVQGLRMGCAREIAKRRAPPRPDALPPNQEPTHTAPIDEIIRYLRQQDDVVVQEQSGGYLVNGRFRMALGELIARANRMRTRQGKPSFGISVSPEPNSPNGHPLFWKETPPTSERVPNGFHQPD